MKKEEDEELTAPNPYDTVFGKRIAKRIKGSYIEKLSFPEFRDKVPWNHSCFPEFIVDLLQYLTGFNLTEYLQAKALRDKEEHAREAFRQSMREEDPDLQARNESLLWEQYNIQSMDEADLDLRALKRRLGDKLYNKLLRFFRNVSKNAGDVLKDS